MANRFEKPTEITPEQTYVSQFVPLPFELMQKKAERQQAEYDKVEANASAISANIASGKYLQKDTPGITQMLNDYTEDLKANLEKVNGDYSKLGGLVSDYSRQIQNSEYKKNAEQSSAIMDSYSTEIKESDMSSYDKELFTQATQVSYPGAEYGIIEPIEPHNFDKTKVLNAINALKPSGREDITEEPDGTFDIKTANSWEGVTRDRISDALFANFWNDDSFNDMIAKRYEANTVLGRIDSEEVSLDEFKSKEYARMFDDYASVYAYKKTKEATEIKENERRAKEQEEADAAFAATISKTANAKFKGDDYEGVTNIATLNKKIINDLSIEGFLKQKIGVTTDGSPLTINKEFKETMTRLGYYNENGTETLGGSLQFLYDIQHGDSHSDVANALDALGVNIPRIKTEVQKIAQSKITEARNAFNINADVLKALYNEQKITKDVYKVFLSETNDAFRVMHDMNKILNNPSASSEEREEALTRQRGATQFLTDLNEFKSDASIRFKNKEDIEGPLFDDVYRTNFAQKYREAMTSPEAAVILKNRIEQSKNTAVGVTTTNMIRVVGANGKVDTVRSQRATAAWNQALRDHPTVLLDSKIATTTSSDTSVTPGMTLGELLQKQAGNDKVVYKELVEKMFKEDFRFAKTFNPETGNMMVEIGKHLVDLTSTNFNLDHLKDLLSAGDFAIMRANQYLQKAFLSPSEDTEIIPGILINTEKVGTNMPQDFSNIAWNIRIDPNYFGVDYDKPYLSISNNDKMQFLTTLNIIEHNASLYNGYVYNTEGMLVPKQEMIEELIADYTN